MSDQSNGWLLAIDTSTEQASIALFNGVNCAETTWPAGRDQTVSVLDQIDHLLNLSKLSVSDLRAIGIATGPGMFNGLRVGMSVAKGFALTADIPLIGVPTLDAVAFPHGACGLPIVTVLAAGRGRMLWATYKDGSSTEPRNGRPEELVAELEAEEIESLVAGEISTEQKMLLAKLPKTRVPPFSGGLRRASAVAELAWRRFERSDFDDPVNLEPTYLHAASPRKGMVKG